MNEFKILMEKLLKLTVLKVEDKAVQTAEGFVISYNLQLHNSKSMLPSVQVILRVTYEGQTVEMWGCSGEEDQQQVVDFFLKSSFEANTQKGKLANVQKRRGIELFEKL